MKKFFFLSLFITLCSCQKAQTTVDNCTSVSQDKEVNTASTPTTFGGFDKIAISLGYTPQLTIQKIMLKASNIGNPSIAVDIYRSNANQDPDSGEHLGGTQALAESSPSGGEVWFKLAKPIAIDTSNDPGVGNVVVLSFGGNITLDYGSADGSQLRTYFTKSTTPTSWGYADRVNSVSFGYQGLVPCF